MSDLGVGLLVQLLYVEILVMKIEDNSNNTSTAYNSVYKAYLIQKKSIGLGFASWRRVFALTFDRFLVIQLHLRYQELVTHKRVVAAVISVWVFDLLYDFLIMGAVVLVLCVIITGLLYCKIYAAVRHHRNQMRALQVQQELQNGEKVANAERLRKSALTTFYVYVVYLACYLPISCVVFAKINGETVFLSHLWYFTLTLVFLNSSLNPLIYCWKMMRHIRQTVMDILRNVIAIGPH